MSKSKTPGYGSDLAYIHDLGFGGFARSAAAWLLEYFSSQRITEGLVIDLGCGSGILAAALVQAGYEVLGYDLSPAMIDISRRRVPTAKFVACSFLEADLPPCIAVTAIGEIFNYAFDGANSARELAKLFGRVYDALLPGGVFVFDGAEPGRAGKSGQTRNFTEGEDWACLFTAQEDRRRKTLTREITSFRKVGKHYRRDHETHVLRLFDRRQILAQLRSHGFRVRTLDSYGSMSFPPGYVGVVAHKPK